MSLEGEHVLELISHALDLEDGDEQIALCEEAVRHADLTGDLRLRYFAREMYVRACAFGGDGEKALVAFSWLLAQFDRSPDEFDQWAILWKYKWIAGIICNYPQVPKDRIYQMLDDLEERSLRAGYGLRAVTNHRYRVEKFWGNGERAAEYFHRMEAMPQDDLNNCLPCEADERVSFAILRGDDEQARRLATSLIDSGKECRTVPHRTYANILLPLLRLGRPEEAMRYHLKGYGLITDNKMFLDKVSEHIIFLTLTENFGRALGLIEKHYLWTEKNRDAFARFRFFRAAWLLFDLWAVRQEGQVRLNLPRHFPLFAESGSYDPGRLADWFKLRAWELATRFDERNETDYFMRTLHDTPSLAEFMAPFPVPGAVT